MAKKKLVTSKTKRKSKVQATGQSGRSFFSFPSPPEVSGMDAASLKKAQAAAKPFLDKTPRPARDAARRHLSKLTIDEVTSPLTVVDRMLFALSCSASELSLPGYATLDDDHVREIDALIKLIEIYIDDGSRRSPLNFLMLASPGAGKSHFIDCIAKRLNQHKVAAHTFNMASMSTNDELIRPLDDARNTKVEDRIPLLFLDEFDSSPRNFALLLPLLWDGSLSLGQRDLKLNKSIIVMAGSSPTLPEALNHARSMRREIPLPDGTNPKLIDLFSRINGSVLKIPPFYDVASQIDRRSDKVAITVNLLRRRFGESLRFAPLALFRLIAQATFRYDVRSIAHLIQLIPFRPNLVSLELKDLSLPVDSPEAIRSSSLAYHLVDDQNQAHGVARIWDAAIKCSIQLPLRVDIPVFFAESDEAAHDEVQLFIVAHTLRNLASAMEKASVT